jgi:hypothetical protein
MLYEVFRRSVGKKLTQLLALGVFSLTVKASAVNVLTDGNSVVTIDPASQAGLFSWVVDGQQQSFQQWFWYRIGGIGGESSIDTISAPVVTTPDGRTLGVTFANAQINVQVIYSLLGGTAGSGNSDVSEQIRITNLGATPLDFHFFQYVDFDLLGSPGSDSIQLGKNLSGKYNEAFQNDGVSAFAETVTAPGANHGEANTFSNTVASLNDGNPTTLSDSNSAGPGDVTWALEWDVTIAAGGSFILSKDLNLTIPAIPEPSVFALISMGALCFAYRRSRR